MAIQGNNNITLSTITRYSDVAIAIGVVGVLVIMIIPLPTMLLDILLSFSISSALIILLVSIYLIQPLEFSVFPSLLLIITLYRLSLNIASTRLILLHGSEGSGAAGQVIKSFGSFVVEGNYVVGAIIFLILVIINFIVITKGSVRTSEVAARFTLDAIPGKQMSIDADLNAGIIDEAEARQRRLRLQQEADFYGAMDGAIRFVRGDAIAGIIITVINIIGGLVIGLLQQGMGLGEAVRIYTLLTIGDGLVSQLPALIVSTAAGIVVTRAASEMNLGMELTQQILVKPRVFVIAGGILLCFGMIPGLPHISFIIIAILAGIIAYLTIEAQKGEEVEKRERRVDAEAKAPEPEVEKLLPLDIMELDVGYELIPLVDTEKGGELLGRIKFIRRQFALDMGIILPLLHIRDNLQLKPSEYSILIKGVDVTRGEVKMNHYLAMNPGTASGEVKGIPTKEPTFGLPALWITEGEKDRAQLAGYTVVDLVTVITTHIKEVIKSHAYEFLGRQEVQRLLDNLKESNPKVVEELIPGLLSLGGVQKVLQNLLKEQISIRDLPTILETIADYAPITRDTDLLTEYVRQALARPITKQYQAPDGTLPVVTIDKDIEDMIIKSIKSTEHGSYLALEPNLAQKILTRLKKVVERFTTTTYQPVILSSPQVRMHLRRLTERFISNLTILSYNEVAPNIRIQTLGVLNLRDAD
ncbi:MAG: flagellar biosynthesis protein FlhA [Nitrospinae bacterium]|nr:flagellar biosynthesis protein FlhA [Nitrospinota bacterium]